MIVSQRLAIDDVFSILAKITHPIIANVIDILVLLRALAVSDVEIGLSQAPELNVYPGFQTSQIELFVLMHFCQFCTFQLRIVSLNRYSNGLKYPLTDEVMKKSNSVSLFTSGAVICNCPVLELIVIQGGTVEVM